MAKAIYQVVIFGPIFCLSPNIFAVLLQNMITWDKTTLMEHKQHSGARKTMR